MAGIVVILVELGFVLVCTGLWLQLCRFLVNHLWKPVVFERIMSAQGIHGPPQSFFLKGYDTPDMESINHDILLHTIHRQVRRVELYGKVNMSWLTSEPRIDVADPEVIRKVLLRRPDEFGKSPVLGLLGNDTTENGVFDASGSDWVEKRRVPTLAFQFERVKGMLETMVQSTESLLRSWEVKIEDANGEAELDVFPEFGKLTTDIIARVAFGSTFESASRITELIRLLFALQAVQFPYSWLPFTRTIPTPTNIKRWRVKRELNNLIRSQIQTRLVSAKNLNQGGYGDDLLGMLLNSSKNIKMDSKVLIDQCKTFYATGTGSLSASYCWAMMLLALHPEWQDKARAEVQTVFKHGPISLDGLNQLKLVDMIIRETLRLYPPMPMFVRLALKDVIVGDLFIPKGLGVTILPAVQHHDPDLWGEDVYEFNPLRFANGSAAASKHPMGFMAFSFGIRACVGRYYAQVQMKLVIAMLLQRFSWSLSPCYRHNPVLMAVMHPKYGMPILLKKL